MCKPGSATGPNPESPIDTTPADTGAQHQQEEEVGDASVGLVIQIVESRLASDPCLRCLAARQQYRARSLQDGFLDITFVIDQCQTCGHRSIVVDESGPSSPMGRLLTLSVRSPIDLERDAALSSTASLSIPEIGLDLGRGQLGRQFIKVGALLSQIYADLERSQRIDDDDDPFQAFMQEFRTRLDAAADFSIVIDDPFGRSLVSGVNAANIAVREYARAEGIPAAATTTLSP